MQHRIEYGTQTIHFTLAYSKRKTLGIQVYPDRTVKIVAPENATEEQVLKKVENRASWIVRQQQYFERLNNSDQPERQYVSGETYRYLGRQYRLRVREDSEEKNENVKLKGKFFYVFVHDKSSTEKIKKLLNSWFREHARKKFRERLDYCYNVVKREGIKYPSLEVRTMSRRWGSCTTSGRILLNPLLIHYPLYCIDYVIIHELCHLIHPNHSKDFYRLKEKFLPDWQSRKQKLEGER